MSLSTQQKKHYRTIGHNLHPIVTVAGKGLTETVQLEVDRALEDHELIKVKFAVGDRNLKKEMIRELCSIVEAEIVQEIGHIALIYRRALKPNPNLTNII